MKKELIIGMAFSAAILSSCGPTTPQLGKSPINEVINAMTLEEKAHLVIGTGMAGFSGDSAVIGKTKKLVPGAAGTTYPIERLGLNVLKRNGAYRARTCDPLLVRQMLSQLS